MDKLFEHVRPYDFLGIWGSGIIVIIYSIFTGVVIAEVDFLSVFKEYQSDYSLLIIFILSVAAYFVGTILHEAGKMFCDFFFAAPEEVIKGEKPGKRGKWNVVRLIRYDFYETTAAGISEYKQKEKVVSDEEKAAVLELMIAELKNSDAAKIIDRYHALYGLTRGIMMGILIHLITMVVLIFSHFGTAMLVVTLLDLILLAILMLRSYRYYLGWIKCVLNQYMVLKP